MSKIMYGHTAKALHGIEGPKYLRITDIQDYSVDWTTVPNCPFLENSYEKYKLLVGDIVFASTGATTGKSFLIVNPPEAVFASYLIRVQVNSQVVDPNFLYLFFQSPKYWNQISAGISGSAQGGFNAKKLGELIVPIPPLSEQKRIVAILDQTFTAIDQAKANIEKNIENARELFQSKLNEVFSQKGEGWEKKKLETVGVIQTGTTPPTKDKANYGDYIPFVKPAHFSSNGEIDAGESKLSRDGIKKGRLIKENSVRNGLYWCHNWQNSIYKESSFRKSAN